MEKSWKHKIGKMQNLRRERGTWAVFCVLWCTARFQFLGQWPEVDEFDCGAEFESRRISLRRDWSILGPSPQKARLKKIERKVTIWLPGMSAITSKQAGPVNIKDKQCITFWLRSIHLSFISKWFQMPRNELNWIKFIYVPQINQFFAKKYILMHIVLLRSIISHLLWKWLWANSLENRGILTNFYPTIFCGIFQHKKNKVLVKESGTAGKIKTINYFKLNLKNDVISNFHF